MLIKKYRGVNSKLVIQPIYEFLGGRVLNFLISVFFGFYYCLVLKHNDELILMEYLTPRIYQNVTKSILKRFRPKIRVRAFVHLSGDHLEEYYVNKSEIRKRCLKVDGFCVFGSSLKNYLISIGIHEGIIISGFHYVDRTYYKPKDFSKKGAELKVLFQGNLKRDFDLLQVIISKCPQVNFTICSGIKDLTAKFSQFSNVRVFGFLPEPILLEIMQNSDVSLNVFHDTIGSNVITTSMACGMAIVASDVGSIRDYVEENSSILCSTADEFINAISLLSNEEMLLMGLKKKAYDISELFSYENQLVHFGL